MKTHERFWSKVDRLGPNECWEWKAGRDRDGYGVFCENRKQVRAARMVWVFKNGPIPDGLLVCHHCDNPPCCNPAHLFIGTNLDNVRDRDTKGRHAKLTSLDVRSIRHWLKDGRWSQQKIAEAFGICQVSVSHIKTGKSWAYVLEGHVMSKIIHRLEGHAAIPLETLKGEKDG